MHTYFVAPADAGAQRKQNGSFSTPSIRISFAFLLLLALVPPVFAQSIDSLKAGVVRITSQLDDLRRSGTGFIVRLENDAAFILTASHVVEGDNQPRVEFFTRRNTSVPAEVLRLEGGDPRGLALLVVRGRDNLPPDLRALTLAASAGVGGGEPVIVIGFPQGGGAWAVLRANVVSHEGREITLDGSIGEGNSGGPVLREGRVIGVVTSVGGGGGFGRAAPVMLVRLVLDGWGVQLAGKSGTSEPSDRSTTQAREAPSSIDTPASIETPAATEMPASADTPASGPGNPNAGKGQASVIRTFCERLQSVTGYRITLYGDAQGPVGAMVRVMLVRDGKEIARADPTCGEWKSCVRPVGGPEKTDWTVRSMIFPPTPSDVTVYVQDAVRGNADNAYARVSAQTGCLLQ